MADIVGTAYVRIKALTDQLAKEIESSIKKGMADAKTEGAAKKKGAEDGEAYGDGLVDSAGKKISKRSDELVPSEALSDQFEDVFQNIRRQMDDVDFDGFRDRFKSGFDIGDGSFEGGGFDEFFEKLSERFGQVDDETRMLVTRMRVQMKRLGDDTGDKSPFAKSLDKLEAKIKKFSQSGGSHLGFLKLAMLGVGGAIIGALPFIQDAGSAILAYATGLLAQVGFITTAIGGLGVAAAAAIGSAAVVALPIMLAFKSETEFLLDFKDSIAATGEEFLRIGTAAQQTLLPALDGAAITMTDLIDMFSEFGLFAGLAVGNFATLAAETLTSNEAQGRFQAILRSSLRILDILTPTLINIGDILSAIWVAALPAAERFAGSLRNLTDRWAQLTSVGLDTGHLTNMFDTWYDRAATLFSALGNLSGALFDILQVGANSSDNVFDRFDEWAERYRDWTESEVGQNKLKLIFDNSLAVMREVNGVVADLFDGIFGRLGEVGGVDNMVAALQRFRDVIPEIQEFWDNAMVTIDRVVRALGDSVWEKITQAWEQMEEPLGRLGEQLLEFLSVMNESGAFEVFLDLMEIMTDTLAALLSIPGFGQFVAYMLAFNTALKIGGLVLKPFVGVFAKFAGVIVQLIRIGAAAKVAATGSALKSLAEGAKAVAAANAAKAVAGVGGAAGTAATKAGGLAPVIGTISSGLSKMGPYGIAAAAGVALVGGAFLLHQRDAQKWEQEIRQVVDTMGVLNGLLDVTGKNVARYIEETSRFDSRNQIDDLQDMGIEVSELGKSIADGTSSLRDFVSEATKSGQIDISATGLSAEGIDGVSRSLSSLQSELGLTDSQVESLMDGFTVVAEDGTALILEGNTDIIKSYEETRKAIGAGVKDTVDDFATNAQNIRLLGRRRLEEIRSDIAGSSDEEAVQKGVDAMDTLARAARRDSASIKVLSDETRDLIDEQLRGITGPERAIAQNRLLNEALREQRREIRANLDLFASESFAWNFGPAKAAVEDFAALIEGNTALDFSSLDPEGNLDKMLDKFPQLGDAAYNLFTELQKLPADEFNAAAQRLGIDADVLKGAMEGATQAIVDLQEKALSTLPSVGELLDDATKTKEDGSQFFDREGFVKGVQERTTTAAQFGDNIARIQEKVGDEAARLAAEQGPEAAKNIVSMIGHNEDQLAGALKAMEDSEAALSTQIAEVLGPGIAAEYAAQARLVGSKWGPGLAQGLNSPENLDALAASGAAALNTLESGFRGHFVWLNGQLRFFSTGVWKKSKATRTNFAGTTRGSFLSEGGFVGNERFARAFAGGPKGSDTVAAWLTPGEFVLRRAVAQAIPAKTLQALNSGDPRIISLLTSLSKNRPAGVEGLVVANAAANRAAPAGAGITIGQMNIEAPTPLESARQTATRLGILHTQLTRR